MEDALLPWCPYARCWLQEHPDEAATSAIDWSDPLAEEEASMMGRTPNEPPDRQVLLLQELIKADVASNVLEISSGIWAIHGDIPVDRDVIMGLFDTYHQARTVLDKLLLRA